MDLKANILTNLDNKNLAKIATYLQFALEKITV
jgi:hypothetical protein